MLTLAAPLFLAAGVLAALVPLALHLIRRRPPARSPLPTARFLAEDARSSIRVSLPTDRVLMALRMLLLVLAGAALARPAWTPAPRGTREVVLLDRSAAPRDSAGWRLAVGEARRMLLAADGSARGDLILFDTIARHVPQRRITAALFDSLAAAGSSARLSSYAAALRALEPAARELRGADSVRVTMVSALRWDAWRPGTAALRRAAWPGAIRLVDVPRPAPAMPFDPTSDRGEAIVVASGDAGRFVGAALEATGWPTRRLSAPPAGSAARVVVALGDAGGDLRALAATGETVIVDATGAGDLLPVENLRTGDLNHSGDLWFGADLRLAGAGERVGFDVKRDASVLAVWGDGRPAVVAAPRGEGCIVFVGTRLEEGELPLSPAFPRALERMAYACDPVDADGAQPLDVGARAILAGRGPALVSAAAFGTAGGFALGRWLMGAALLVALAETGLAYRRRGVP